MSGLSRENANPSQRRPAFVTIATAQKSFSISVQSRTLSKKSDRNWWNLYDSAWAAYQRKRKRGYNSSIFERCGIIYDRLNSWSPPVDKVSLQIGQPKISKFSEDVWIFVSEPDSTAARIFAKIIMLAIYISIFSFVMETLPTQKGVRIWDILEDIGVVIFSVEFLLRFGSYPNSNQFFKSFLNIVDLLAILPFYLKLITPTYLNISASGAFKTFRLIRVFRLMRHSSLGRWHRVFERVLHNSLLPLAVIMFGGLLAVLGLSSAVYMADLLDSSELVRDRGHIEGFDNILTAMYWALITMSNVGYGDVVPRSTLASVVGGVVAIVGLLALAVPVSIVKRSFEREYAKIYWARNARYTQMQRTMALDALRRMGANFRRKRARLPSEHVGSAKAPRKFTSIAPPSKHRNKPLGNFAGVARRNLLTKEAAGSNTDETDIIFLLIDAAVSDAYNEKRLRMMKKLQHYSVRMSKEFSECTHELFEADGTPDKTV